MQILKTKSYDKKVKAKMFSKEELLLGVYISTLIAISFLLRAFIWTFPLPYTVFPTANFFPSKPIT